MGYEDYGDGEGLDGMGAAAAGVVVLACLAIAFCAALVLAAPF